MNNINKGWFELESDPGLFTLLLGDFGVHGVQVDEIYDLQKPMEGPVYGFIFLFKWIEERRSRRKITQEEESFVTDENVVNSMFFAQQVIPNSCATHALLSVLLNCENPIKLGNALTDLNKFTQDMNPEAKGYAIGNMLELARAHNSHARPEPSQLPEKQQGISVRTAEAFHFVSYVPTNGRLFELDGLKPYPIDHGPWGEHEEWTDKFYRVITERLGIATGGEPYHDIRFNLMAVVPDRQLMYEQKLKTLKTNRHIVLEALQQMVKFTGSDDATQAKQSSLKTEPIVTRSVAAREAARSDSPVYRSTRLKQKAAAAEALADAESDNGAHAQISPGTKHEYLRTAIGALGINSESNSATAEDGVGPDVADVKVDLKTVLESDVKIHIAVADDKDGAVTKPTTVATTDVTKPLTIQTKFAYTSPGPGSESTDTASEVGSCYNSPICSTTASGQSSPNTGILFRQPLAATNMETPAMIKSDLAEKLSRVKDMDTHGSGTEGLQSSKGGASGSEPSSSPDDRGANTRSKFTSNHGFTPKDLLDLLKNVEHEIACCEANLQDEREKKKKYKIDDCRRTHNYDQFICTLLSMLAEQGHLADLVEQHMLIKRRHTPNAGQGNKTARKADKRRRSRPKKRK